MVVYWEYAFAENFLLDGLLLYLALKCARTKAHPVNLLFSAGVGAAEAVCFPLITLPVWAAYLLKFAGGLLLAVLAVRRGGWKTYLITAGSFFLMTFALGGLLVAGYSFFGAEYKAGNGFLVERAPVSLVLAAAGIFTVFTVAAAKYFYRYRRLKRNLLPALITAGKKTVRLTGFADSGNLLSFRGKPVSVISGITALALFGGAKEEGRISVTTVNGTAEKPVFRCDVLLTQVGKKSVRTENAYLTVGDVDSKEYKIILHTAMTEGNHENLNGAQRVAPENTGRKRCKLSLRK